MTAVDLGLVADGFTWWFTVLVVAVTALVWLTVGILRWMDTAHQPPVEPAVHVVNDCDRGGHYFQTVPVMDGLSHHVWRCVNCGDLVKVGKSVPFDQEAS